MLAKELMKRDVECVSSTDTVRTAAARMRDANVGFLPVCDDSGKALGTLTDRDIAIRLVAEDRPASEPVEQVMTRGVVACRPEEDLRVVQERMGAEQKSRIICTDDDGRPLGVISLSDIAEHEEAGRAAQTMREVTRREAA